MPRWTYFIIALIFFLSHAGGVAGLAEGPVQEKDPGEVPAPSPQPAPKSFQKRLAVPKRKPATTRAQRRGHEEAVAFVLRVNIIKSYPGFPPPSGARALAVINGAALDNFAPQIQEVYTTPGLVLDEKGHILSYIGERWIDLPNYHTEFEIVTPEGPAMKGRLVGVDERKGFAVVACPDLKAKPAPIETTTHPQAGSMVKKIEIMKPNRIRTINGQVERWDSQGPAVIKFMGPSPHVGEPILGADGKVLGIIIGKEPVAALGRRMPTLVASMAEILPAAQQIIKTNTSITSGWIGVYIDDLTPETRQKLNIPMAQGILVREVIKDSPAKKAGLQAGDIIQKINKQPISDGRSFVRHIQATPLGQTVTLGVLRSGVTKSIRVRVEKRKPEDPLAIQLPPMLEINTPAVMASKLQELQRQFQQRVEEQKKLLQTTQLAQEDYRKLEREFEESRRELIKSLVRVVPFRADHPTLGIFCNELSAQLGEFFGAQNGKGILVNSVLPSAPADVAGVKAGDVVLKIDHKDVAHCSDLVQAAQRGRSGRKIKITVLRQKKPLDLYVTLNKESLPPSPSR